MNSLFPDEPVFPAGFSYVPGFITEAEETALCQCISKLDLHPLKFQGFEAKRKVQSFGFNYHFDKRTLSPVEQIPVEFSFLVKRVADHISVPPDTLAKLLVTEYPPGSVINWHRDAPPFELIAGISLLSDCIFRLRPHDKARQSRSAILSFPVARRSLYIMKGESREAWQHSIAPVKQLRYSLTLRTLKTHHYGNK